MCAVNFNTGWNMNNNSNLDEREISLVDLFMYLVKRYRSIILVAIICATIVCAGAFCKAKFLTKEEDFLKYERELTVYNTDHKLLEIYEKKLTETQLSLTEKPLISVSSHNLPTSTITLCVEGTYAELLSNSTSYDPGDSILNNIMLTIQKGADWASIAEKYGVNTKYVQDLVELIPDYNSNIVVINTHCVDSETAEELLEDIVAIADNNLSEILDSYRGYYIKKRNNRTYIDTTWVNDIEENTQNSINYYVGLIDELNNKYEGKDEPKAPDYFSVLRGIKYALIGGVLGGVAMAGIYCVIYLLNDCLREEDELHNYFGFTVLGVFGIDLNAVKGNAIDKFLLKKQYGVRDNEYVYGRIAENINLLAKKDEKILLAGTVDKETIESLYAKLGSMVKDAKIICGGNLNEDNEVLAKLDETDSVIFVERRDASKMKNITREVETVNSCKKRVLGYILY